MSGGEEEVDQEEEPRPVLGGENSRVRQQRVELLVKVGVLQIVSGDGKGKLSKEEEKEAPRGNGLIPTNPDVTASCCKGRGRLPYVRVT